MTVHSTSKKKSLKEKLRSTSVCSYKRKGSLPPAKNMRNSKSLFGNRSLVDVGRSYTSMAPILSGSMIKMTKSKSGKKKSRISNTSKDRKSFGSKGSRSYLQKEDLTMRSPNIKLKRSLSRSLIKLTSLAFAARTLSGVHGCCGGT